MAAHTGLTDEEVARTLQTQFDLEYAEQEELKEKDSKLARAMAKAHTMSDSESDDSASGKTSIWLRTGSEDLFDDYDDDNLHDTSKKKSHQSTVKNAKVNEKDVSKSTKKEVLENLDVYDDETDVEDSTNDEEKAESSSSKKPLCKYGSKCYRKNPSHAEEFYHPSKRKTDDAAACSPEKRPKQAYQELQPFNFFLTKVKDIKNQYNSTGALNLKDLLSERMGSLKSSCHFNFMFDMEWLVKQYPESSRKLPLLLVHGDQGRDELRMKAEAQDFPHISLCRAPLDIPYGTHHTKMMLLLYTTGLRVVIHTANLIPNDWCQKTQGIWVSPVFSPLANASEKGDSPTGFKTDLLQYLAAYKSGKLAPWERHIQAHDMKTANVHIIGSVPGRHVLSQKNCWGHLKLKKVLSERGPEPTLVQNWPLLGQFSSIGSLGPNKEAWLTTEWAQSLNTCKGALMMQGVKTPQPKLNLVFPSKDNIRLSLEGYNGGGCVPYSIKTASKQPWLTPFFCQWISEGRGRTKAVPHIKTYTRHSPDGTQAAWFIVTSANLSKAAWGALEKKGSQLMIRSYELGVLFLPQYFGYKTSFPVSSKLEDVEKSEKATFPLPYDLPPTTYVRGDRPWFVDVPCVDLPDTFGNNWCPPL
ncbi:tyrosyl-DNA phosphodiesterase 1-like [Plakobranchus ocellatus]|uniref:Tyrosyl-DNA phosphodiesterase 1-like n=1 Tax=Plakobranchus ocellatus TaxID=259542 RepID=A0AAV4CS71_9GAST|nr:tyrosyl-DNA phosphodiesterase 1-like [Plakobranchus ocellatus]